MTLGGTWGQEEIDPFWRIYNLASAISAYRMTSIAVPLDLTLSNGKLFSND